MIGHGSVSAIDPATLRSGKTSSFSRERPKTARLIKEEVPEQTVAADEEPEDIPETDRSGSQRALSSFNTNRRNFREPPSSAQRPVRNRQNLAPESSKRRNSSPDLSGQASIQHETISTDFAAKKRNNFRDRNPGLTRSVIFDNCRHDVELKRNEDSA